MGPESPVVDRESRTSPVPGPEDSSWRDISGLQCHLSVALRVEGFRVRDLLALEIGSILNSPSNASDPVPVWVNGVRIGLAEFDVLGARLAIRMSELE
jgi:flagellar motor switch/type III secretory pathway protein FliN